MNFESLKLKLSKLIVQYRDNLHVKVASALPDEPLGISWNIVGAVYSGKYQDINYGLVLTKEQFDSRGRPSELEHSFQNV